MRAVLQRVKRANVSIEGRVNGAIGEGLMVLFGVEDSYDAADLDWLVQKIVQMRIFSDEAGLMNLSVKDINGEILVVSQFTLFAKTKKGNRPSFIAAARPEKAVPIYESFVEKLSQALGKPIPTGEFGADMQIDMLADGPVTIIIDTQNKE
ncbi:MAG: D-tyrosyl-tRNA(Tyr) deacylase [Marinilabiliaceae bacterium]|nr:D-tyrosyl-tRNA(Tyr) deacylase [Marinilabiliaceae bacterium]